MLAYILALIVAFSSLTIYLSAFFFPEIHRKNDFIWSGVGLFYALVLWIFAPRITGGLLLGHVASVALLVWSVAQTLSLRRQLTPAGQQTPLPSPELIKISFQEQMSKFSVKEKFGQLSRFVAGVFGGAKEKIQQTVNKKPVIKTADEILRTNGTETRPPSVLADESVTATPAITTEALSEETVSQSSMLEVVEVAPIPPTVMEEQQVIPPTEPETVVEITQTEVMISESSITGETETVVEITQTEVVIALEETSEMASAPEVSSPNSVTSELLAAEAAEKSDLTVEEVKPVGEALPEQIPINKPVGE
jgi:hypothetical protein